MKIQAASETGKRTAGPEGKRKFSRARRALAVRVPAAFPDHSFWADVRRLRREDTALFLAALRCQGCRLCRYRDDCGFDKSRSLECRDFTADARLLAAAFSRELP